VEGGLAANKGNADSTGTGVIRMQSNVAHIKWAMSELSVSCAQWRRQGSCQHETVRYETYDFRWLSNSSLVSDRIGDGLVNKGARIWTVP
jgi:hypothetical protein